MKILHVNTSDTGGAFVAARRLHTQLVGLIDSKILVLYKSNDFENTLQYLQQPRSLSRRIADSFRSRHYEYSKRKILKGLDPNSFISTPRAPYRINFISQFQTCDLVHLHWVANFLDLRHFFATTGKPIVWTLHDMNPFLGLLHYSFQEGRYNDPEFKRQDYLARTLKRKLYHDNRNHHFVAPSNWIKEELLKEMPFLINRVSVIHNGINTQQASGNKAEIRKALNILTEDCVIVFASADSGDERKGLPILLEALNGISSNNIVLIVIGSRIDISCNFRIIQTSFVEAEHDYYTYLCAADVFVAPSLQDNLPNTLLEAMVTGLALVGFNTGGIPEMITHGENGFLSDISAENLAERIKELAQNKALRDRMGNASRIKVATEFNIENQAKEYVKLYDSLLV